MVSSPLEARHFLFEPFSHYAECFRVLVLLLGQQKGQGLAQAVGQHHGRTPTTKLAVSLSTGIPKTFSTWTSAKAERFCSLVCMVASLFRPR